MATMDVAALMRGPPPLLPARLDPRRPKGGKITRKMAMAMLCAATAATIPGPTYASLRNSVGIKIPRTGPATAAALWRAMMPKGILHDTLLQPATAALRALANAPSHAKCFMFKRGQCPRMIHPDTVFMLTNKGWMFVAFTIAYISGKVGCSRHYKDHYNRVCKGYQCNVELHHKSTRAFHFGLCFVEHFINRLISAVVSPPAPDGCTITERYVAFPPWQCLENIWKVKDYERRLTLELVDDAVECERPSGGQASHLLWDSLASGGKNEDFLEPADRAHRALAGLDRGAKRIFQFKPDRLPELVDASCVLELYYGNGHWRLHLIHGRCPILGIGGTRVAGHSTWPLVLHHIQYSQPGTPYSLVSLCHQEVNLGIDCIPNDDTDDDTDDDD